MKKSVFIFLSGIFSFTNSIGQIVPPYSNNFDIPNDTLGWVHYAIQGTDDWERGTPTGPLLNSAYSAPNAWGTNLEGNFTANSVMILESPSFDFSGSTNYYLSFRHMYHTEYNHGGNIEYSTNGGSNWFLLDGPSSEKSNWHGITTIQILNQPGWSGYQTSYFVISAHKLNFLTGSTNVKFRFKFGGSINPDEGWLIDNFNIQPEAPNIVASNGDSISSSQCSQTYRVNSIIYYPTTIPVTFYNRTDYYFSYDQLLDVGDTFLGSKFGNISGTVPNWTHDIPSMPGVNTGDYFIIYQHDVSDSLIETIESDNTGYCPLHIDTCYIAPVIFNFKDGFQNWESSGNPSWVYGKGISHHAEGTHSDSGAVNILNGDNVSSYLESPYINASSLPAPAVSYWFNSAAGHKFMYTTDDGLTWNIYNQGSSYNDDWDYRFTNFSTVNGSIKFRLYGYSCAFDDFYFGYLLPDISIFGDVVNRFTSTQLATDTIHYELINSGWYNISQTTTTFYWSADSLLDGGDFLLGNKLESAMPNFSRINSFFTYTKPTSLSEKYYIIYVLDTQDSISEMVEENNSGYFILYQQDPETVPYFNDFETQVDGWRHNSTLGRDEWQWTMPAGIKLDTAFSGTKVWITNDTGNVSPMTRMHLYTPVFDFTSSNNPVLEFDMKFYAHPAGGADGKMNMSFSTNGGKSWQVLETTNSFNRWYYQREFDMVNGFDMDAINPLSSTLLNLPTENTFTSTDHYNGRDTKRNTRYNLDLSQFSGLPSVQFRYNIATTGNYPAEGAMIDNFHIRDAFVDLKVDYQKHLMLSSLAQKIHFSMDILNAGNYLSDQNIDVQFYISSDTIINGGDFYLGSETISSVRADHSYYLNSIFNSPGNLSGYNYLLYNLDPGNAQSESDEINNIGYWYLSTDSVTAYPYFQNFNDTVFNGWNFYLKDYMGIHIKDRFRFRNIIAPGESLYGNNHQTGQMFTDFINQTININLVPFWYLESPAFDFSQTDSVFVSFDLMCWGETFSNQRDGGNMEYSIDGGTTWNLINGNNSYNWYNSGSSPLDNVFDENGWLGDEIGTPFILDSASTFVPQVSGTPNVVFRFKYRSKHTTGLMTQGMRIDNFYISGVPLVINNISSVPNTFQLYYSENNIFIISQKDVMINYRLLSILGKAITPYNNKNIFKGKNTIPLPEGFSNGIYIIELYSDEYSLSEKIPIFK